MISLLLCWVLVGGGPGLVGGVKPMYSLGIVLEPLDGDGEQAELRGGRGAQGAVNVTREFDYYPQPDYGPGGLLQHLEPGLRKDGLLNVTGGLGAPAPFARRLDDTGEAPAPSRGPAIRSAADPLVPGGTDSSEGTAQDHTAPNATTAKTGGRQDTIHDHTSDNVSPKSVTTAKVEGTKDTSEDNIIDHTSPKSVTTAKTGGRQDSTEDNRLYTAPKGTTTAKAEGREDTTHDHIIDHTSPKSGTTAKTEGRNDSSEDNIIDHTSPKSATTAKTEVRNDTSEDIIDHTSPKSVTTAKTGGRKDSSEDIIHYTALKGTTTAKAGGTDDATQDHIMDHTSPIGVTTAKTEGRKDTSEDHTIPDTTPNSATTAKPVRRKDTNEDHTIPDTTPNSATTAKPVRRKDTTQDHTIPDTSPNSVTNAKPGRRSLDAVTEPTLTTSDHTEHTPPDRDQLPSAEEASEGRRSATAKLLVTVKPVDASPPVLAASSREGYVEENSPVGTRILDEGGNPIQLTVSDADLGPDDPKPVYAYEFTNGLFDVDNDGYLIVATEKNLDRDPPSPGRFKFQVIAREKTGNAASAPLTLSVVLTDVNDNAPHLPMIPPISIQAGEGHRKIIQVNATDNDLGENAVVSYSIYHVSNNGRNKFTINPQTGEIDSVGKLTAGEQYSITVQATDTGGKSGQTIVEVKVIPGPNTRTPVFKQDVYKVIVSEGAPINSPIATITAEDPEQEKVSYSIISGNDLRQFAINDKTGVISVIRKLDREDLTRYQLTIKAEDEGGLSATTTVNIFVSDINDKNPEFIDEPYNWSVKEGLIGAHVGVVHAVDADEGMNANITYSVPDEVPFTINPQTGTIMTSTSLDYEKQNKYKFVVTAKDGGSEPRIATATVTVAVIDTEDELPVFHQSLYEATVPENIADYVVTVVKADDPDTKKQITYVIKQGPTELFTIDPKNGTIRTLRDLDYESEKEYELVIGTLENNTTHKGATTTVRIKVEDVNDIHPVFLTIPTPITLYDNESIGTEVTKMVATDADGTAPGNKVRYEIIGQGKATKYFQIDSNSGTITVKGDLKNEPDNEYQVDVKASDMGDPQLSTVASVPIFVSHVAVSAPPVHLGFPDDSYTLQIREDAKPGSLLKSFTVIASTSVNDIPLRCSIVEGNRDGMFQVNVSTKKTCDLMLGEKQLDYENQTEYTLKLRLDSLPDYINQNKSTTMVKIQVLDVNDNTPKFIYPMFSSFFNKEKYFGAVAKDKKEVRAVLQVKAEDMDSSALTDLEYSLVPSEYSDYFSIDAQTGSIRTKRSLDAIEPDRLPVRLTVMASDGKQNANTASTDVVINIIDEGDRMVLPILKIPPETTSDKESLLSELLSKATGKMVGIDKVGPLETSLDNVTLTTDSDSTDLWLYFIDPISEKIIHVNDSQIVKIVRDNDVKANITSEVTTALGGGTVLPLHLPVKVRVIRTAVVALDWEVFPYAVILIAALILVLGSAGIIYICISWQRYRKYKERVQRMYVMPRYDPVFVEPHNLKEYETQVLQMSVPMDDNDSYHDLQLDFSHKNHAFSLDNVSYITKDHGDNGGHSPTNSETATTARASTLGRHRNNLRDGAINLSYDRSDDEIGHNSSPTNDNITFREKKDYSHLGFNYLIDRSPIETTTEL